MDSVSVDIIILPDNKTSEQARLLGSLVGKKYESLFTLEDRGFTPHITIYQFQCPTKNYTTLKERLKELSASLRPLSIKVEGYEPHSNFIFWNVFRDTALMELHKRVLEVSNQLREGLLLPHILPDCSGYVGGSSFTREQKEAVMKYGAVYTGELFKPHITLARIARIEQAEEAAKSLPGARAEFPIAELCLGKMGPHGTVLEILERSPLG